MTPSAAENLSDVFLHTAGRDRDWVVAWYQRHISIAQGMSFFDIVKAVQANIETTQDGILGPATYRRMLTADEAKKVRQDISEPTGGRIIYSEGSSGRVCDIPGVRIDHSISLNEMRHNKYGGSCGGMWGKGAKPKYLATIHWDVALSAQSCASILVGEGYGSSFGIDNPGPDGNAPVYQWMIPGDWYGYHAGSPANKLSAVSFDLSNAVSLKYQDIYTKRVGKPRPVVTPICGPHVGQRHLGMYKGQIVSLLRMLRACSTCSGLPFKLLDWPGKTGLERWFWNAAQPELWKRVESGDFQGVITHQNITSQKWDVRCLWEQIAFHLQTDAKLRVEFQDVYDGFALTPLQWADLMVAIGSSWENPGN